MKVELKMVLSEERARKTSRAARSYCLPWTGESVFLGMWPLVCGSSDWLQAVLTGYISYDTYI